METDMKKILMFSTRGRTVQPEEVEVEHELCRFMAKFRGLPD